MHTVQYLGMNAQASPFTIHDGYKNDLMSRLRACLNEWGLGWITESAGNAIFFVLAVVWVIGTFAIRLTTKRGPERITKYYWWWAIGVLLVIHPWAVPWLRARCYRSKRPNTDDTHQDVWGDNDSTELAAV